jgi:LPS-assembly lipoprotein
MKRALLALTFVAALPLAACGFTPLYGDPALTGQLSAVEVNTPPGRVGALLREHLDDQFARGGQPPAYRMNLELSETRYPRGLRVNNIATRYEYVLVANYALTAASSGAVVKRGHARVQVTYDSADQPYASIAAQQDAQDRAAGEAARRIQLEVAAYLSGRARS